MCRFPVMRSFPSRLLFASKRRESGMSADSPAGGPDVSARTLIPQFRDRQGGHGLSPRRPPRSELYPKCTPANSPPQTSASRKGIPCSLRDPEYNSAVPTVFRSGPYRAYFYSHEPNEPAHVHIDRDNLSAKFWLNPVALARNFGFSAVELARVQSLVAGHLNQLLEAWNGHFGVDR